MRIADHEIADAFNMECAEVLFEFELKHDEALMTRKVMSFFGEQRSEPTPLDLRDQGW